MATWPKEFIESINKLTNIFKFWFFWPFNGQGVAVEQLPKERNLWKLKSLIGRFCA